MSIVFLPEGDHAFPQPDGTQDSCVAASGDLSVQRLLAAYRRGIFPWYEQDGLYYWFATAPRTVLYPSALHIGRSLQKNLRNRRYRIGVNRDFAAVIAACAQARRPEQDSTWISSAFQAAYRRLHQMGHAHSFEYYCFDETNDWRLAGGLYGVQIGRVFYGESMFAQVPDASKIAFVHAVKLLAECGVALIDCQQDTHHLARFGSQNIDFSDFQAQLALLNAAPLVQAIPHNAWLYESEAGHLKAV